MRYANAVGGKLLHLAIIQHAAVGKPHIITHPIHLPAACIAVVLRLYQVQLACQHAHHDTKVD